MASQRTGPFVQTGLAEVICAMPGRAAMKAAPVTPSRSIRWPFAVGFRSLESEWMGAHMWAGEPLRYTITCWPTRTQNVVRLSRLPRVSGLPGGTAFAPPQTPLPLGLAALLLAGSVLAGPLADAVPAGLLLADPLPAVVLAACDPQAAVAKATPVTRTMARTDLLGMRSSYVLRRRRRVQPQRSGRD
jgi:hypothetical protein